MRAPVSTTLVGANVPALVAFGANAAVAGVNVVLMPSSSVSVNTVDAPMPATFNVIPDAVVSTSTGV